MHVFIDESGSFSGFGPGDRHSLAAVGALSIPDSSLPKLRRKFENLRRKLTQERGEVKGRNLSEKEVASVVEMLLRNDALLEISVTDVASHSETGISAYRDQLADYMQSRIGRFNAEAQKDVALAVQQIRRTPPQLFLQAILTMDVLERVLQHVPLYFAQRQPKDLGSFKWVVDSKERAKTTNWELWWSTYCQGVLAARSKRRPGASLQGADYSYFDSSYATFEGCEQGTDLKLLMSEFRFSPHPEMGLELIDILTNAVRRALTGNLASAGWQHIPRLMIHRRENCIGFVRLDGASVEPQDPTYASVAQHFSTGGKTMLSPRFLKEAANEQGSHDA